MKRLWLGTAAVVICAFLLRTTAFAHGGMEHVLGTVTAVTGHSLSVKTRGGAIKAVEVDGQTKFLKGEDAATIKDIQVGTRVAVHARKNGGSLHAAEVRIGTPAPSGQR